MAETKPARGQRVAALLAIGGLVGALVAIGFAILHGDAWRIPLGLVAVGVAVIGLWYLVSRRGAGRVVGGLLAAAGVVTVLLVILTATYRGLPFVVAIVLVAVSAVARATPFTITNKGPRRRRRRIRGRTGPSTPYC